LFDCCLVAGDQQQADFVPPAGGNVREGAFSAGHKGLRARRAWWVAAQALLKA
jgi:hypothetical protein